VPQRLGTSQTPVNDSRFPTIGGIPILGTASDRTPILGAYKNM